MRCIHLQHVRKVSDIRGFTLVETLVSITILLIVIVGPLTIASKSMQSAFYAGDQITAIYLAQEAIEHIQRLRDDAALLNYEDYLANGNNGNGDTWDWYDDLSSQCKYTAQDPDGCDIHFDGAPLSYKDCSIADNCNLNKFNGLASSVERVYGYTSGTDWTGSIFTRVIRVGALNGGGVPVTVTVSWNSTLLGGTRTVTLQTYVYDSYTRYE